VFIIILENLLFKMLIISVCKRRFIAIKNGKREGKTLVINMPVEFCTTRILVSAKRISSIINNIIKCLKIRLLKINIFILIYMIAK